MPQPIRLRALVSVTVVHSCTRAALEFRSRYGSANVFSIRKMVQVRDKMYAQLKITTLNHDQTVVIYRYTRVGHGNRA